jgi:hypothetical protein
LKFLQKRKARQRNSPAGLGVSFDLSGRLVQAMAVRRHGCPMMMVMAVMAEALHLLPSYVHTADGVKYFLLHLACCTGSEDLFHANA